jgi:hypothetical protein
LYRITSCGFLLFNGGGGLCLYRTLEIETVIFYEEGSEEVGLLSANRKLSIIRYEFLRKKEIS